MLFVGTLYVLYRGRRENNSMQYVMLGSAITMWIVSTVHLGLDFSRILTAFITHRDDKGGPGSYLLRRSSTLNSMIATIFYFVQTLVGDSFLLYRMAIVWGNNWRIIAAPFVLLLANAATASGAMYHFVKILTDQKVSVAVQLVHWIVAFLVLTLLTNFVCTALIGIRIWKMNTFSAHIMDNSNLKSVMLVIMESGAVYSCVLLALLICYFSGLRWAAYLLLDALVPIIGIVFSMVIIRLGLKLSDRSDKTTAQFTSVMSTWNASPGVRESESLDKAVRLESYRRDSGFECDREP